MRMDLEPARIARLECPSVLLLVNVLNTQPNPTQPNTQYPIPNTQYPIPDARCSMLECSVPLIGG